MSKLNDDNLNTLNTSLNKKVFEIMESYIDELKLARKRIIVNLLATHIKYLKEPINNNDPSELTKCMKYTRCYLAQTYTFSTAFAKYYAFVLFIKHLIRNGVVSSELFIPGLIYDKNEYEEIKGERIPMRIMTKIKVRNTADEEFNNILSSKCTPEIATRLKEHVNSFKHAKHHRTPLTKFITEISSIEKEWFKHSKIIQGELLRFRDRMLENTQRNSAYCQFQNVKNAISVLIEHGLLPSDTYLPDNLRRNVSTQKIRKDNPLISNFNIYDESKIKSFINTALLLDNLKKDISSNLSRLLDEAKKIVYAGYNDYCLRDKVIARSQRKEFLSNDGRLIKRPFSNENPLRNENLTAYHDYFFDELVNNKKVHTISRIRTNNEILSHLGLTPLIASAMQIIIVEELGINPYSLYNVKVSSSKNGVEFVQVTDEGAVRLKALKARAKKTIELEASGSLINLKKVHESDIDASICFKMAIEMTTRTRNSLGNDHLWTCLTNYGACLPSPETFQSKFKTIINIQSIHNLALKSATLKKVRTSKGLLIYLNSNGDSLKTAQYFGNSVKTTLARYIPKYLTELIYRVKIRAFQNILLFMAVSGDDYPYNSIVMSKSDFLFHIKQAFNNPEMGGNFYDELTKEKTININKSTKYFCLSSRNIALAIYYAKNGTDEELKSDCKDVLLKIADGPVIMKQMLRKVQLSIQEDLQDYQGAN